MKAWRMKAWLSIVTVLVVASLTNFTGEARAESQTPTGDRDREALQRIANPPLGLPAVPFPSANPPSVEKILLGRKLFFDPRLSANGTMSCGTCHLPEQGFTVTGRARSIGHGGVELRRNAPTVLNAAYLQSVFLDGRRDSLEAQALDPLISPEEMANSSLSAVLDTIRGARDYDGLFEKAFGGEPTSERLAQAISTYERTLLAANSPFDRWYYGGQQDAIGDSAKQGFELFTGRANCATCHTVHQSHALFTDNQFHDDGTGWRRTRGPAATRAQFAQLLLAGNAPHRPADLGRFEVSRDVGQMFWYRTPSLRNVALTAPYMHDGSFETLRDVVDYYNKGGFSWYGIDPRIKRLELTRNEKAALVAFLESLTADTVPQ